MVWLPLLIFSVPGPVKTTGAVDESVLPAPKFSAPALMVVEPGVIAVGGLVPIGSGNDVQRAGADLHQAAGAGQNRVDAEGDGVAVGVEGGVAVAAGQGHGDGIIAAERQLRGPGGAGRNRAAAEIHVHVVADEIGAIPPGIMAVAIDRAVDAVAAQDEFAAGHVVGVGDAGYRRRCRCPGPWRPPCRRSG